MRTHPLLSLLLVAVLLAGCTLPSTGTVSNSIPTAANSNAASEAVAPAGYPAMQCTSISAPRDVTYFNRMPYAEISENDWARGSEDAPITVLVYSDFQCPTCATFAQTLARLQAEYPDAIRIVYRHYPLIGSEAQPLNDKAAMAVIAAEAAGQQGMFWEMYDVLYGQQALWATLRLDDFQDWLVQQASALGMDGGAFSAALLSEELAAFAQAAWDDGQAQQLGTPPYVITNEGPHGGPIDYESLSIIFRLKLLAERQFNRCPDMQLETGKQYLATIRTGLGDIVVELFPEVAPFAVNSFVFLAEQGWFKDTTFHRVLPGFVAQAGDPSGTGYGGPGYAFGIEPSNSLTFDRAGLLAMANAGPTSNGSQFFITYGPASHLNGGYTIFGQVIQGMDIVEQLTPRDPSQAVGLPPGDTILDITIEEQ
ncbi:MAG TPA: peptidylprolyl isomerase [Anaerolineales bacterium]|nr:peptidylprolyl isomerase [Anaerolineales bacterium]HRQ92676.1 peptidylprolyl isomerase [Anaerolineales bacterium]